MRESLRLRNDLRKRNFHRPEQRDRNFKFIEGGTS